MANITNAIAHENILTVFCRWIRILGSGTRDFKSRPVPFSSWFQSFHLEGSISHFSVSSGIVSSYLYIDCVPLALVLLLGRSWMRWASSKQFKIIHILSMLFTLTLLFVFLPCTRISLFALCWNAP